LTPPNSRHSHRDLRIIRPRSLSPSRIISDLGRLGEYVDLLTTLTAHRIRVRYKQSALGLGWAIAQPVALMAIYTVIFSVFAKIPSEGMPYAIFVFAALLPWTFFSSVVASSAASLVAHTQLITKVYFPREILPLTYVLAGLVDFAVAGCVLAAMMFYYRVPLTTQALWTFPIMLVAVAFTLSAGLLLSALQVSFRDIGLAMPLLMQVWAFSTPVVYPLNQVPTSMRWWYDFNPMVGVVENFRRTVILGQPPDMVSFRLAALIALVSLPLAYLFFKYREATMADVI
jgi:lipopolysaccharide transport system permease protein